MAMTMTAHDRTGSALRGSSFAAQSARYLAVGSTGTVLYLGAYAALALVLNAVAANILAWALSRARPFIAKIAEPTGLPNDPELLVKANGAAMVAAGAGLATGVLRKPSALVLAATLVPTTIAGHPFWEETDPAKKAADKVGFAKNLGLMGGMVLALVDTYGKPGLLYRAKMAGDSVGRTAKVTGREARHAAKAAKREAKIALLQAKDAVS